MRANGIAEYTFDGSTMFWKFADGTVEFNIAHYEEYRSADDFIRAALVNGFKQKIADAAALPAGSTAAEKRAAMQECVDRLGEREWNAKREGTGVDSMLVAVLVDYYKGSKTAADVRKQIEPWSSAERRKVLYSDRLVKSRKAVEAARKPKDDGTADRLLDAAAAL